MPCRNRLVRSRPTLDLTCSIPETKVCLEPMHVCRDLASVADCSFVIRY